MRSAVQAGTEAGHYVGIAEAGRYVRIAEAFPPSTVRPLPFALCPLPFAVCPLLWGVYRPASQIALSETSARQQSHPINHYVTVCLLTARYGYMPSSLPR